NNGWKQLHRWGRAAITPIVLACQPSPLTANASTNGKLGRVMFSIGTLKHASMVEYFRDNKRSRCRNRSKSMEPRRGAQRNGDSYLPEPGLVSAKPPPEKGHAGIPCAGDFCTVAA